MIMATEPAQTQTLEPARCVDCVDSCCDDCRELPPHVDERVIEELLAEELE
jgi:hypothetical protein